MRLKRRAGDMARVAPRTVIGAGISTIALSAIACFGAVGPASATTTPAPTTSPSVTRVWAGGYASASQCSTGYLCAYAWYGNGWYEFKFYSCGVYNLYNWHDPYSVVIDDQTGGVVTSLYGQYGNVLQTMRPAADTIQDVLPNAGGWNPVYSIRVC